MTEIKMTSEIKSECGLMFNQDAMIGFTRIEEMMAYNINRYTKHNIEIIMPFLDEMLDLSHTKQELHNAWESTYADYYFSDYDGFIRMLEFWRSETKKRMREISY